MSEPEFSMGPNTKRMDLGSHCKERRRLVIAGLEAEEIVLDSNPEQGMMTYALCLYPLECTFVPMVDNRGKDILVPNFFVNNRFSGLSQFQREDVQIQVRKKFVDFYVWRVPEVMEKEGTLAVNLNPTKEEIDDLKRRIANWEKENPNQVPRLKPLPKGESNDV